MLEEGRAKAAKRLMPSSARLLAQAQHGFWHVLPYMEPNVKRGVIGLELKLFPPFSNRAIRSHGVYTN